MTMTVELMKANHVDAQGDHYSEAALKDVAEAYKKDPSFHRHVTMGFSPNAKAVEGVSNIIYSCGALLVTLDGEAEKLAKAKGLVPAAGGHMATVEGHDGGVRHHEDFLLDRIALVKPEEKIE